MIADFSSKEYSLKALCSFGDIMKSRMKHEIAMFVHGFMRVSTWRDINGLHTIQRDTVDYLDIPGVDAGDVEKHLNKIETRYSKMFLRIPDDTGH
jgi:hypothetical protein